MKDPRPTGPDTELRETELGEGDFVQDLSSDATDPSQAEIQRLRHALAEVGLPREGWRVAERELLRLEGMPTGSAGRYLARSFLELVLELPWNADTEDVLDLRHVGRKLNETHHGLEQPKARIVEHLAVRKRKPDTAATTLCFVGAPGVGRTSLCKSLASALGRPVKQIFLAGVGDESELRGNRRSYLQAKPGRILQAVHAARVSNPVIVLADIDKLERDLRGDPMATLLEVFDGKQNTSFRDDYLDMPFDLSKVLFVATAQTLDDIPRPLLDCLEPIPFPGYSDFDKLHITRQHLLPRWLQETGLQDDSLDWTDQALCKIIRSYTNEAGVRQLERLLGSLCRRLASRIEAGGALPRRLEDSDVEVLLGRETQAGRVTRAVAPPQPGIAATVASTRLGGDVLEVEAVALPDSHELIVTGDSSVALRECVKTAQSFIRSQWAELNIDKQALSSGIHVHVPVGATRSDDASVGLAIAAVLASLYTFLPARRDTALTGAITLTGRVLPVLGLQEKIFAAHRADIRRVIIPAANEKDLVDLPDAVRKDMEIVGVDHVLHALSHAIPRLASRLEHALPAI